MTSRTLLSLLLGLTLSSTCAGQRPEKAGDKDKLSGKEKGSDRIVIESVLVTLIEQVEVPARELGVLDSIAVREGDMVEEGAVLARIDDTEVQLAATRARIERDIATKEARNDLKIRFADKSLEVAAAEMKRAIESVEKYRKSVSATEMDRLRLASDKAALEVEQSHDDLKTAALTAELKENEFKIATRNVERRKIIAPISGVVVQINSRRGEWVEPGKPVIRILRINRLRAEGFLNGKEVGGDLTGRRVVLTASLPGGVRADFPGAVVFVSPEINPVNGQVRFWAEIENRDLLLRPGMNAAISIDLTVPKAASR